jgi:hypothetical protein
MISLMIGTRRIYLPWRTIPFLVFDMCGSTVFLKKQNCSLSCVPSLSRNLIYTATAAQCYPCVLLLCVRWFFNKRLEVLTPLIDPIAGVVSCIVVSDSLSLSYFLCIPTSLKSGRHSQVKDLEVTSLKKHRYEYTSYLSTVDDTVWLKR